MVKLNIYYHALQQQGIPHVKAKGEAEETCAYLTKIGVAGERTVSTIQYKYNTILVLDKYLFCIGK